MTTTRWCSRKAARAFQRLLEQGWTDALRKIHPKDTLYTFWDYMPQPLAARRRPAARPSIAVARSWRAG